MTRNRRRPVGGHTSSDAVLTPPVAPTGPAPGATRRDVDPSRLDPATMRILLDARPGSFPVIIDGRIMAIPGEDYSETCARHYGVPVAEPPSDELDLDVTGRRPPRRQTWPDNDAAWRAAYVPPPPGGCQRAHPGWVCTGETDHAGPCPLWPVDPADLPPGGAADYVRAAAGPALQLRDDKPTAIAGDCLTVPVNIGHRWTEPVGRITLHQTVADQLCADDIPAPRLSAGLIREPDGSCRLTDVALIFDLAIPADDRSITGRARFDFHANGSIGISGYDELAGLHLRVPAPDKVEAVRYLYLGRHRKDTP